MNRAESAEKERLHCEPLEEAVVALKAERGGDGSGPSTEALIIHDLVLGSLRRHLLIGTPPAAETVDALADFAIAAVSRGDDLGQPAGPDHDRTRAWKASAGVRARHETTWNKSCATTCMFTRELRQVVSWRALRASP